MTIKQNFNYSNKITSFATELGRMVPEGYCRIPEVGDLVEFFSFKFLDINIEQGSISKILTASKYIDFEELRNSSYVNEDIQEEIEKEFDCFGYDWEEDLATIQPCVIKFEKYVSKDFILKNLGEDFDFSKKSTPILTCKGVKAKLFQISSSSFLLKGTLKSLIHGNSVINTHEIIDFKNQLAKEKATENIAWSDRILEKNALLKFNNALDNFCINETPDFHPGSNGVVRNIIHPSLYCFMEGISKLEDKNLGDKDKSTVTKDFWGRKYESSIYQWLPSEFEVSKNGTATINSYINNLNSEKYPDISESVRASFEIIFPLFEKVCGSLRNDFYGTTGTTSKPIKVALRNKKLQIITKIVEYRVNEHANFDGVWHAEGMSHENILATAICILKRDSNFVGADLEFRRFLLNDEGEELIQATVQNGKRPTDNMGGGDVRPLGTLKTPVNRCIVFPNSHLHRVSAMASKDGSDAIRRILVFWLINPETPIVSTKDIESQQSNMPIEVAHQHRLSLMSERKKHKEDFSDREVSLCEH
jgi:hypothetical protein